MLLYDSGRAPNPRRVKIFLAEKGVSVPSAQLDIGKQEHKSPEYTGVNPLQRVPSLVLDDGTVISESVAICRYFEELRPEPPLFGTGALGRATVEMWQRRVEFELLGPVAAVFRHLHPMMAPLELPQVPAWGEANRDKVGPFLTLLDGHLSDKDFICGDLFTIADITALVGLDFMKPSKLHRPEGLDHLSAWYGRVSSRPSAAA